MNDFAGMVQEINRKLNSGQEFESVFHFLFYNLNTMIPYDRIGLALVDESGDQIHLKWVKSKKEIQNLKSGYSAPLA